MSDYGMIRVEHVPTNDNRADVFTKAMDRVKFIDMRNRLNIESKPVPKPKKEGEQSTEAAASVAATSVVKRAKKTLPDKKRRSVRRQKAATRRAAEAKEAAQSPALS